MQSSRWQTIARVPEKIFEAWIANTRAAEKELTQKDLLKIGRQQPTKRQLNTPIIIEGVVGSLQELVEKKQKFTCIYSDPPWKYGNQSTRASTDNHYSTMTIDEICKEPIAELSKDKSILFLWTTASFLPDSFKVLEAWGFTYKSNMVWVKPQMGIGNYVRVSHEHLLIATKGGYRPDGKNQMSWINANRTKHSRKPIQFRQAIEKMCDGPYLEMYGREKIDGWTVYGNQIEKGLLNEQFC